MHPLLLMVEPILHNIMHTYAYVHGELYRTNLQIWLKFTSM